MTDQWIPAAEALSIVINPPSEWAERMALCARAHSGLVRTSARLFIVGDDRRENVVLPTKFWWAEGHEALEQDWERGDFSTWIEEREHWSAFSVSFDLQGLLEMLPFERRAIVARQQSVTGNPEWTTALAARRIVYESGNVNPVNAGSVLLDQCRLGFVSARAVLMQWGAGAKPDEWATEAREWDIPQWFWQDFTISGSSSQDWERGVFAGRGISPMGRGWITLTGVHFLIKSLPWFHSASDKRDNANSTKSDDTENSAKRPVSNADLQKWWDKKASVADQLSQDELVALARAHFTENHISRDRIRELSKGRKRGPRPLSGE